MTKIDKLIERLLSIPKDFTYTELLSILNYFGYKESTKGKTSGSRVMFIHKETEAPIRLHKPKPILKEYAIKQIIEELKKENFI
ncbi:type II toxin-antitoxin system HicA family toxin [Elizabethkingia anophelis]|uniref:type II toxin-antitoxin system HicA family toxin n=1 Tax=Elizabethkingia anophelis TaxID=1117645 RepID=UPI0009953728|nr:type II toxin-antitoxin system HicA family toxin [Elizabethkingia anophelis]AQW98612.1 hexulose-6-phosphate isomerase [Elizabethkingia anophelis]AQX89158.1 hexulose-6-phosphate isomerase [Elizabethkingia anophelis]ASV78468.1 addiction module toxin, HicA family [Elizabethkingia anophelis]EHM7982799.1 type II toxin-antitoxin system HicA family toxin [Elizabethkingia anophelis]EHM8030194.1 type II toxin-antitoxin system HicA family toxin [Elizabethkingia anophelis]